MARLITAALITLLLLAGCAESTTPPTFKQALPTATQQPVSFNEDVRPIVEAKCLACHSCFDAPCQLKMEYSDGLIRLGKEYEFAPNSKLLEDIELGLSRADRCVSNEDFSDYASDHPYEGMPLAMTGLTDNEYATLTGWLNQGGAISPRVTQINETEQNHIQRWESRANPFATFAAARLPPMLSGPSSFLPSVICPT